MVGAKAGALTAGFAASAGAAGLAAVVVTGFAGAGAAGLAAAVAASFFSFFFAAGLSDVAATSVPGLVAPVNTTIGSIDGVSGPISVEGLEIEPRRFAMEAA